MRRETDWVRQHVKWYALLVVHSLCLQDVCALCSPVVHARGGNQLPLWECARL